MRADMTWRAISAWPYGMVVLHKAMKTAITKVGRRRLTPGFDRAWFQGPRLKLEQGKPLSNFAFNFDLRHYTKATEHGFGICGTNNTYTSTGALGYYAEQVGRLPLTLHPWEITRHVLLGRITHSLSPCALQC